jgi:hypothetical protein
MLIPTPNRAVANALPPLIGEEVYYILGFQSVFGTTSRQQLQKCKDRDLRRKADSAARNYVQLQLAILLIVRQPC